MVSKVIPGCLGIRKWLSQLNQYWCILADWIPVKLVVLGQLFGVGGQLYTVFTGHCRPIYPMWSTTSQRRLQYQTKAHPAVSTPLWRSICTRRATCVLAVSGKGIGRAAGVERWGISHGLTKSHSLSREPWPSWVISCRFYVFWLS